MELAMRSDLGEAYKSASQKARVITEAWVEDNMYCPACSSDSLEHTRRGLELVDFRCGRCHEGFQAKSKKHPFGRKVVDSAWRPMSDAVSAGKAPGFFFLQYGADAWRVSRFFVVPGHFVTPMVIERRARLRETARRAGWTGCNIILERIADAAKIPVVEGDRIYRANEVRERWRRFAFVREALPEGRGWIGDVLSCVQRLGKTEFTLNEMYGFAAELGARHPGNKNVRPKIRQQLQILRKQRVVEFLERGRYRLL
ncbi:MAG TPA: DpnI domain-containing protein [Thermoplasmata archaeon]|nr:DpnI domain-containing protein [Thermoplasmata archaeon]